MTNLRQVAQQALEALKSAAIFVDSFRGQKATQEAITALQTELAQPEQEQEPVAWMKEDWTGGHLNYECVYERAFAAFPVYTTPLAAQRKPLTATTIGNMMPSTIPTEHDGALMEFARAIEAAHNIKEGT
jgi:predicted Fe-Mo cluster-binding NifX family protein